ncbi:MAG TPA: AraC family transcriptional regulator, partial [Rikenellaceae bacterium]|nr:AraC family transcriptional regulator [Rikenellaceae bacterium]
LLQENGVEVLPKAMFEKYLNDPALTKPEDLLTELWIPIA